MNFMVGDSGRCFRTCIVFILFLLFCDTLLASTSEGIVVGIYHCAAQSDCSLLHKGFAFSGIECYNKYCDSDCAGIQYNADSFDCYKLRQRAECWGVEHTNDNIYLYRDISRTGNFDIYSSL